MFVFNFNTNEQAVQFLECLSNTFKCEGYEAFLINTNTVHVNKVQANSSLSVMSYFEAFYFEAFYKGFMCGKGSTTI